MATGPDLSWRTILLAAPAVTAPLVLLVLVLGLLGHVDGAGIWAGLVLAVAAGLVLAWRRVQTEGRVGAFIDALADGANPATLPGPGLGWPMRRLAARWAEREARLAGAAVTQSRLLDLLPDPLLQLGPGRMVVAANRAAAEILGPGLAGRPLEAVLRDPKVLDLVGAVLDGTARGEAEFALTRPVARDFLVRVARLSERADDGTLAVLTLSELTERKRLEAMRVDFVANASHEIRTPLAALAGYIETLRGPAREDAAARERFLGIMAGQVERMTRLVADLLSLSRIELHEHAAPSDPVALAPLLARVAEGLAWKAEKREMRVALDVADDLPPVLGDAGEVEQVFQNLLDNAIKYGAPGTEVRVEARLGAEGPRGMARRGPAVAVAFSDRGPGIAREHLPRLTERFYRVDAARSRDMGGTGLGLAIVKHIVSRHRGHLAIESAPGQGSTFTVHLPTA